MKGQAVLAKYIKLANVNGEKREKKVMGKIKISEYFKLIRLNEGLSLRDAENKYGISKSYIHKIESGDFDNPSFVFVNHFCKALNISLDEFIRKFDCGKNVDKILKKIDVYKSVERKKN